MPTPESTSASPNTAGRVQVPRDRNGLLGDRWATACTGRSMRDSHQHLMITEAEWQAFLDDFQQTLDKFAVPQAEQAELKAIAESTRADIVV